MYDIYFDLANMHQTVEEAEEEEQLAFNFDWNLDFPEDNIAPVKSSNGYNCQKCGELYPYAEPNQADGLFKCWGCRHF
jgi:hypothetical protein